MNVDTTREPDFWDRNGKPIWCAGEPNVADIKRLLEVEGTLTPSDRMAEFMLENGCWHIGGKPAT